MKVVKLCLKQNYLEGKQGNTRRFNAPTLLHGVYPATR